MATFPPYEIYKLGLPESSFVTIVANATWSFATDGTDYTNYR